MYFSRLTENGIQTFADKNLGFSVSILSTATIDNIVLSVGGLDFIFKEIKFSNF